MNKWQSRGQCRLSLASAAVHRFLFPRLHSCWLPRISGWFAAQSHYYLLWSYG